jgi:hypothetical protein
MQLGMGIEFQRPGCGYFVACPLRLLHRHAFLWEDGEMVDLNTLIPENSGLQLVYAESINDAGEIVGIGVPPGISPKDVETLGHAFVLIPEREVCHFSHEVAQPGPEISKPAATPEAEGESHSRCNCYQHGKYPETGSNGIAV